MQFRSRVRALWRDPAIRWLTVAALVINGAAWAGVWFEVPRNSAFTPLHYTIYFGINLTGSWLLALAVPALGLAVILMHLLFSLVVEHPVWPRLWVMLAVMLNVLVALDVFTMILLIRSGGT